MRQTWQSGIDIRAASVYSGMFSQIFKQECGLYRDTVFFFVRMSIQEFLAAHYVLLSFIYIAFERADRYQPNSKRSKAQLLQQSAVDMALQSRNGHLYLFLHVPLWLSRLIRYSYKVCWEGQEVAHRPIREQAVTTTSRGRLAKDLPGEASIVPTV